MLRTGEADCPKRLRPGDVVESHVAYSRRGPKRGYVQWAVLSVVDLDELRQSVVVSAKGMGSARFEWYGGHHRIGHGHNMKWYFMKHGTPAGWNDMATAPKDCTWLRVILPDGTEERAHWAQDLSGECQPAYRGWFKQIHDGHHAQIPDPVGWLPDER